MKNFKKLFSIVAIVAMMGTAVPTATLGAASYSDELQGAYDYAYGIGITTQSSIDTANMYGSLLRSHMAKMMVNYATEVMGQTPDTSKTCEFTDVANQTEELQGYITQACQLGLMGVGITAFNPNGVVTRAQFGTVLDRVLNGSANDGGDPYYTDHLQALKDAGIMTNISNPNAPEVRGYVMLMMQRADEGTTPAVCETPENVLSCSLGLDTCPAECENTSPEVKAGSLDVSLGSDTLPNNSSIPSTGTIKFAAVKFAASSTSDVSLKTVELSKVGLTNIPLNTKVWFEKDGIRVSGKTTFSSENKAIISFAPAYVIKKGGSETLDLYVELATSASKDLQFESTAITSSAEETNGGFRTPILRTTDYSISTITMAKIPGDNTYNASANSVEIGAFSLALNDNKTESIDSTFKSITLTQSGNANLSNLSNIVLERNGVVVAKDPVINGKYMTFSAINNTIKDGTTANYYVKAVVDTVEFANGDQYQLYLKYTTDMNVVEAPTMFRNTVAGTYTLGLNTVNGGDITFARDTSVALSETYAAGTDNVVLMKGSLTSKHSMTLTDLNLVWNYAQLQNLFTTVYVKVGGSTFSFSPIAGQTTWLLYGTVTVDGKVDLVMYGKLKDNAPGNTSIKFNAINLGSFDTREYDNGNTVATSVGLGSIDGVNVSVNATALNVVRTDGLGSTTIAAGTKDYTVYRANMTVTQGNGVTASNIAFFLTGNQASTGYLNNGYLSLYVDGVMKSYKKINSNTITFDGFSIDLLKNVAKDIQIKADFDEAFSAGSIQLTLTGMNAIDKLSGTGVTYNKPVWATFTMATANATITTSTDAPLSKLLLSPSAGTGLYAFKVTAVNDSVRLYNVRLSGTNLLALNGLTLVNATGDIIATATTVDATNLTFETINAAPFIAKDKSETYYVVASTNQYLSGNVTLNLSANGVDVKSSNGTFKNITSSALASISHMIKENAIVVTKLTNTNKELGSSALVFTVKASGVTSTVLTGLSVKISTAGYSGDAVIVYKNSVNSSNIAFASASYVNGANATWTTYNAGNATIDAGTTITYIVVLDNARGDGTTATQSWTARLSDVNFGDILGSTYTNVGAFPMTDVK